MADQTDMTQNLDEIRSAVREHYATAARTVALHAAPADCCGGGTCCGAEPIDAAAVAAYDPAALADLPQDAVLASLGCGNPTALAELRPGEVVLDLGSGGGIDVLLSARRVGEAGFAYGLDMTDEMLDLAERNRAEAGVANVQFLKGHIEEIPLPAASVDVVISNCVINLSGDKDRVLAEAFRVLRPGGRFAVSDIVLRGGLPPAVLASLEAWSACVAGALTEQEYRTKLTGAGFAEVEVEPTHVYALGELIGDSCCGVDGSALAALESRPGSVVSAFVRARKPGAA
ncbi:MAG TPA: arsenite methyltransferase [Thermomicrobiaceae bacterium]|nr:arsenite methyltransferase [Thermomicrobiaceae bacterium]